MSGNFRDVLVHGCSADEGDRHPKSPRRVDRRDYEIVDEGLNAPEKRWAETLMMQAITGNTNMKIKMTVTSAAEPGTEQAFLERVIPLLLYRSRGCSLVLFTGRPARPKRLNLGSPMEVKWSMEVMKSVYSLSETEANEIPVKLYSLNSVLHGALLVKYIVIVFD